MRKFKNIAFVGAIALAGAAFTACSSESDIAADNTPVNPTYDGQTVKTKFAINIAAPGKTRMGSEVVQEDGTFRGMKNISLLTLKTPPTEGVDYAVTKNIQLNPIGTNVAVGVGPENPFRPVDAAKTQYIYNDVDVPVGTKSFLFYGFSEDAAEAVSTQDVKFKNGYTTMKPSAEINSTGDITFNTNQVIEDLSGQLETAKAEMAKIMNGIASVEGWSDKADDTVLGEAYDDFTSTGTHAGSASGVKALVEDLYNIVVLLKDDATDGTLAQAIITEINKSFKVDDTDDNNTLAWADAVGANVKELPTCFGLPEGSVQLKWNTDKFEYVSPASVGATGDNLIDLNTIVYPTALTYFVNTQARATDDEVEAATWPTSTDSWRDYFTLGDGENKWDKEVKATSRTIALKQNINYGVAKLVTYVKCASSSLEDNAKAVAGKDNNDYVAVPAGGFNVTGVLVGGQPNRVGWEFVEEKYDAQNRKAVVYDNDLTGIKASTTFGSGNYTLLFDNYTSEANQEKVNIAIELENNTGVDFYGVDGKVAAGQKFYLVAQLDPAENKGNLGSDDRFTWPDYTYYPYQGKGKERVFIQDYTTTANLTIKSLKNAYVTIPDLRTSKMQLGLSVDLLWRNGMSFDVDIE